MHENNKENGFVSLVGAGPGDPELITVKGLARLTAADVVVYDRLVAPKLVAQARPDARRIDVGKPVPLADAPAPERWTQSRINALLIAEARRGRRVVRLKGGDPFVFGRGGEECAALRAAGIDYEVVPGLSSAVAAPAYAGIPVTHRGVSAEFAVVTARNGDSGVEPDWPALARIRTLVVLMGVGKLHEIAARLIALGRDPATPVAVVSRGSCLEQSVARGTLRQFAAGPGRRGTLARATPPLPTPATIVVGDVVDLSARLEWCGPALAPARPGHAAAADHVA